MWYTSRQSIGNPNTNMTASENRQETTRQVKDTSNTLQLYDKCACIMYIDKRQTAAHLRQWYRWGIFVSHVGWLQIVSLCLRLFVLIQYLVKHLRKIPAQPAIYLRYEQTPPRNPFHPIKTPSWTIFPFMPIHTPALIYLLAARVFQLYIRINRLSFSCHNQTKWERSLASRTASVPSSVIVSLNHGCLRACLAVNRCLGS